MTVEDLNSMLYGSAGQKNLYRSSDIETHDHSNEIIDSHMQDHSASSTSAASAEQRAQGDASTAQDDACKRLDFSKEDGKSTLKELQTILESGKKYPVKFKYSKDLCL